MRVAEQRQPGGTVMSQVFQPLRSGVYFPTSVNSSFHLWTMNWRILDYLIVSPSRQPSLSPRLVSLSLSYSAFALSLQVSTFPTLLTIVTVNSSFVVSTSYYLSAFISLFLLSPHFSILIQHQTMKLRLSYYRKIYGSHPTKEIL
jgi:hypothetical protein